jgi:tRNA(Ile)-lysidine synthase
MASSAGAPRAVAAVLESVRAGGLLREDAALVTMLSGGRDSVCLLDVAVRVCGAERLSALHVNYGLRAEADEDERHCRMLCERLGVALSVMRPERERGNVQAWARDVRYRAAVDLAVELDGGAVGASRALGSSGVAGCSEATGTSTGAASACTLIAVGHTASDQVETILYRLSASPGRRALLGMVAAEGRIVRPLLGVTREQTAAYCSERGLGWRDDASNDSDAYARGRVRATLVPALRAVHPAAEANVLRTAQLLREETELLDGLVDAELGGEDSIALERLGELHPALARLVLVRLAERAAGAGVYVPQAGDRVAEILELAGRHGRAELHVGGLVAAVIDGRRLRMVKIAPHYLPPPAGTRPAPGDREAEGDRGPSSDPGED